MSHARNTTLSHLISGSSSMSVRTHDDGLTVMSFSRGSAPFGIAHIEPSGRTSLAVTYEPEPA